MADIHRRLFEIKTGDPVKQVAREMADENPVLGFDEFYVSNIADAMLLGRLFEHLFKYGVVLVVTSNWPMDELFQGGRNRKHFLPFLRILEQNLQCIDLGEGQDYRQNSDTRWPLYIVTDDSSEASAALAALFERYAGDHAGTTPSVAAVAFRGGCGWYQFSDLCEQPLGSIEYMALVHELDTLLIQGIPRFYEAHTEAVLRFVTLIDICYEHRCRVVISAEDYPDVLYADGPLRMAFSRAASRLSEMQTWT